jgi:hypothetical protein
VALRNEPCQLATGEAEYSILLHVIKTR